MRPRRQYTDPRKRGVAFTFNGYLVVVWREGRNVWLVNQASEQRRIQADSVSEAKHVFRAMSDAALKASQFKHDVRSFDQVAASVISICEAVRWFANRKHRTYA